MINAEELRKKRRHMVKHVGKRTTLDQFVGCRPRTRRDGQGQNQYR